MLTGFQLRAARKILNLSRDEVLEHVGLSESTLLRLELQTENLLFIRAHTSTSWKLQKFYQDNNIIFHNKNSIELYCATENINPLIKFSKFHIKISRTALRLTKKEFGALFNITESAVSSWERRGVLFSSFRTRNKESALYIKSYCENIGISYPDFNRIDLLKDPIKTLKKTNG